MEHLRALRAPTACPQSLEEETEIVGFEMMVVLVKWDQMKMPEV